MSLLETLKFRITCKGRLKTSAQNNQHFLYVKEAPFFITHSGKAKKKKGWRNWILQLEHLLTAGLWKKGPHQDFPKPEYWSSQHQEGK